MLRPVPKIEQLTPVPHLDFASYFKREHKELPTIDALLESGGYVGCCGTPFVEEQVAFSTTLFGRPADVNLLFLSTENFKGEPRVCCVAVMELLANGSWYLWTIFFTTCDPFFFDNFTYPLGLEPEAKRALVSPEGQLILMPACPCVENDVFLVDKVTLVLGSMRKELSESRTTFLAELRELFMTTTRMDRRYLREILERFASGVKTVEEYAALSFTPTEEELKSFAKLELDGLRAVISGLDDMLLYHLYTGWLTALLELPKNLYPAEYKKFGAMLVMTKLQLRTWDRHVFLCLLSARAKRVLESPIDASIGLGSGSRAFSEVSDVDAKYAEKTLAKGTKLGGVSPDWLIRSTERVVRLQGAWLGELKGFCDAGDIEAALEKLTDGTTAPGQGLLGLSIALLRDIMTGSMVFPPALYTAISTMFAEYGLKWSLPLLDVKVGPDCSDGVDLLFKVGSFGPARTGSA